MRSILIALAALVAVTQAVSIQVLRKTPPPRRLRDLGRAQATKREIESHTKLFAQQDFGFRIPKGELTQEDKDKLYEQFGWGHFDSDGNHRITFDEAYSSFPEDWRSPELEHQMRQQFEEIDTDASGDVDMDEFVAYWRKTVEPLLDAYEQQMSSYAAEYASYQASYPENGDHQ